MQKPGFTAFTLCLLLSTPARAYICDSWTGTEDYTLSAFKERLASTPDDNGNGVIELCISGSTTVFRHSSDPDSLVLTPADLQAPKLLLKSSTSYLPVFQDLTGNSSQDSSWKGLLHFVDLNVTLENLEFYTVGNSDPAVSSEGDSKLTLKGVEIITEGVSSHGVRARVLDQDRSQLIKIENSTHIEVRGDNSSALYLQSIYPEGLNVLLADSTFNTDSGAAVIFDKNGGRIENCNFRGGVLFNRSNFSRIDAVNVDGSFTVFSSVISDRIKDLTIISTSKTGASLDLFSGRIGTVENLSIIVPDGADGTVPSLNLVHGSRIDDINGFAIRNGGRGSVSGGSIARTGVYVSMPGGPYRESAIYLLRNGTIEAERCISDPGGMISSMSQVVCNGSRLPDY